MPYKPIVCVEYYWMLLKTTWIACKPIVCVEYYWMLLKTTWIAIQAYKYV